MYAYSRWCEGDEDYAKFALYFIRHRHDFDSRFTLYNALEYLLESVEYSQFILSYDSSRKLIGVMQYWYTSNGFDPDERGDGIFVSAALITPEERRSRVFYQGLGDIVHRMAESRPGVKFLRFHAQEENQYLNRLYSKFMKPMGQFDGYNGKENIYVGYFPELLRFFKRNKM